MKQNEHGAAHASSGDDPVCPQRRATIAERRSPEERRVSWLAHMSGNGVVVLDEGLIRHDLGILVDLFEATDDAMGHVFRCKCAIELLARRLANIAFGPSDNDGEALPGFERARRREYGPSFTVYRGLQKRIL